MDYTKMTKEELFKEKESLEKEYKDYQAKGLKLDMSRGKPAPDQLEMAMGMLDVVDSSSEMISESGQDTRNYGGLDGIPECKEIMASIMECDPSQVVVCGNSALNIMYDTVMRGYALGYLGNEPWIKQGKIKWLCPAPGYDRHFAITEHFGIEMINIPMTADGPDMDMVEDLVSKDAMIKGIWCVPKYSNPQGVVYSDETVRRMAALKPAAKDFRVFWDNAYAVHHLYDEPCHILNILDEAKKAGNEDMVFEFASTSKISFAGGGVAAFASSAANVADFKKSMTIQTIGYDKVNQLRHVRFFKDGKGVEEHMKKHALKLRPKFEMVDSILERDLAGKNVGTWLKPRGGYFICFDTLEGCATRTIQLAKECGVVMTGAGAPWPYHKDPKDSTIRISPSYPSVEELEQAANIFTICVRLAAVEKLLG